jgi:hypothetical protein
MEPLGRISALVVLVRREPNPTLKTTLYTISGVEVMEYDSGSLARLSNHPAGNQSVRGRRLSLSSFCNAA